MKKVPPVKELRKICQSEISSADHLRFLRKISIYVTKLVLYTSLTANQITISRVVLFLLGASTLATGNPFLMLIGILVMVTIPTVLDRVDGEVARFRGETGPEGDFMECLEDMVWPFVFFCLTFGVYSRFHQPLIILFGGGAILGLSLRQMKTYGIESTILRTTLNYLKRNKLTADYSLEHDLSRDAQVNSSFDSQRGKFVNYASFPNAPRYLVIAFHLSQWLDKFVWRPALLILLAAIVDFLLYWQFPFLIANFSGMYVVLIILSIVGLFNSMVQYTYTVQTRKVQFYFSAFLDTCTKKGNQGHDRVNNKKKH